MESKERSITLTLERAQEFYNSDNKILKELALQAFSKAELLYSGWKDIKTFRDACDSLGIHNAHISLENIEGPYFRHLSAILRLDIIKRALNRGWRPDLTTGDIHFPCVWIYSASKANEEATKNRLVVGPSLFSGGTKYTLVGGNTTSFYSGGITNYGLDGGGLIPSLGLLGCWSKEIAKHMSIYFMKEIFMAQYGQYEGLFKWE